MEQITYQAIFLDDKSVTKVLKRQKNQLPKNPNAIHCTFKYNPSNKEIEEFTCKLLGKRMNLRVIGYYSDGNNSGFEVALTEEQESVYTNSHTVLKNGIQKVERTTPHITVSMSEDAKAVDTGLLPFEPIEPFNVSGTGGFFVKDMITEKKRIVYEPIINEINRINKGNDEIEK